MVLRMGEVFGDIGILGRMTWRFGMKALYPPGCKMN